MPVMDSITHEGKTYLRAAKIAKELGYTSDYVGQLCREGHVACTRVGRNWFVEEASIRNHKTDRKRSVAAKARQSIKKQRQALAQQSASKRAPAALYKPDAEALLPTVHKEADAPEQTADTPAEKNTNTAAAHEQPTPTTHHHEENEENTAADSKSGSSDAYSVHIQRAESQPPAPRPTNASPQTLAATAPAHAAPPEVPQSASKPSSIRTALLTVAAVGLLIAGATPFFVAGKVVIEAGEPNVSQYTFSTAQALQIVSNIRRKL